METGRVHGHFIETIASLNQQYALSCGCQRGEGERALVENAYGLDIPRTLEEVCHPQRMALIVYDMQIGIVGQALNSEQVTSKVVTVVMAARQGGFRIFFSRHLSLPNEVAGVSQLRTAMAWQNALLSLNWWSLFTEPTEGQNVKLPYAIIGASSAIMPG